MGRGSPTVTAMRAFGFLLQLFLFCTFTSLVQSKHFLVETEDDSSEKFMMRNSDDYADDNTTLTKKELDAVLAAVPKKAKELYINANSTYQNLVQKKIRSAYGHDLEKMVEGAKDGSLEKLFTGGKECICCFCFNICFSGSSEVQTPNGVVTIKDLRLNDLVLTYTPGMGTHYTKFLGWLDRSASKPAVFLNVSTSSSSITLSASHVIFRATKSGSIESVYAGELQEGDKLVKSKSEKMMEEEAIVSIETKGETSYWAPLTKEGTLLVDGFLVSSYASYPHEASQLLLAPVKMFPRLLLDDESSQHEDGVRKSVKMLKEMGDRMGLRRKVQEGANLADCEDFLPNSMDAAIAATMAKNIEL